MKTIPLLAALATSFGQSSLAAAATNPADAFPSRPIRIIVAYPPAGTTDILARVIGQKMTETWGQSTIVENRPGANGNIGTDISARATPDGYTITMGTAATHSINNTLYPKLAWHAQRDFAPISLVAVVPNLLVVNNALPVKSVKDLIAYAKTNPGKLSFGSPGIGATAHLSMELFQTLTGTTMVHVPHKGSAGVLADVTAGNLQLAMDNIPVYLPQARAGKIRALAVSSAQRVQAAPDIPTVAEAGVAGFEALSWFGLLAPAKTPPSVVAKLATETQRIMKLADVRERITGLGAQPVGGTPQEFGAFIRSEIAKWQKVIRDAGVKAE
ncbi:MAG TPA: tripartite tricarboxylate transporter substrate binding protein [Burkholderiales bacterium]|nr:tripartite tricarboxylate transporter substrate binding protein [Burkholderiales bacterium]